jgi:hypothetical protein
MNIRSLVDEFANRLQALMQHEVIARARAVVDGALANGRSRLPGASGKPRRKPPRQLCPVPGCKNTAAPVYGMVCGKHKDVPKAKIKKYREARRLKNIKAAS